MSGRGVASGVACQPSSDLVAIRIINEMKMRCGSKIEEGRRRERSHKSKAKS